jgi:WD40 repeat protein
LRIWDALAGKMLQALDNDGFNQNLLWSPDGKQLASGGRGTLRVWDTATWTLNPIRGFLPDNDLRIVGWSGDGKRLLATGTYEEIMKMWEVSGGRELYSCQVGFWEAARQAIF